MKKRHLLIAVTIIMAALVFFTCDLIKPVDSNDDNQDTYSELYIIGEDIGGEKVFITFSRPAQKAVLDPQDGDNYVINYKGQDVSKGSIRRYDKTIIFTPNVGTQFTGTYNGGKDLSFPPNGIIPGTDITGFHLAENGGNGGNAEAIAIANAWGENARADGSEVHISGDITVLKDITISNNVTLIFEARDFNKSFTIGAANSTTRVTVTARGGIVVSEGRGVTLQGAYGSLVVEGDSTISGRLIVDEYATLDIAEDVTIKSGGVLELKGYETVRTVASKKYSASPSNMPSKFGDAIFKLRKSMVVENGGRFQMPDPYKFTVKYITGVIEVKPGGELILVTSDQKGNLDLHPLIGTEYTTTQGPPIGADFVMNPDSKNPNNRIEVRISGDRDPIPALELTGNATALGRLILDENHKTSNFDDREPPYRFDVWLTYPFTVTARGILAIGNSEEPKMRSSLLITGNYFTINYPTAHTAGIYGIRSGINKGVLTNNGEIIVFKKNGIMEWYGGYFNHNYGVSGDGNPKLEASSTTLTNFPSSSCTVDIRVWSTDWKGNAQSKDPWWPILLEDVKDRPPSN